MKRTHVFSETYENKKEALREALARESLATVQSTPCLTHRLPVRILAVCALLGILTVSVYAAAQWIDFRMEKNGDEVRVHAGLTNSDESADTSEKPLRSWQIGDGEIGIRLHIPDLPADMEADRAASGKYRSSDPSRAITVNGIDLRRSDLDHLIGGASGVRKLTAGDKPMYVIETGGEAAYYNRIAYIALEEYELVLKLWVSYGITDDELFSLASTLTTEETTDAMLAIPIHNEPRGGTDADIPFTYVGEDDVICEAELIEIGESARDANDRFTVTVSDANVYDNISVLRPEHVLHADFVQRFTDAEGNLIPYNRTEILWSREEGKTPVKQFGETVSSTKKLCVVTLTLADVTMDEIPEADRDRMLKASLYGFDLRAYTANDGKLTWLSEDAVVDGKPEANADSSEMIYREYLGNGRWKVAYLIDEADASGKLVLGSSVSRVYVKIS